MRTNMIYPNRESVKSFDIPLLYIWHGKVPDSVSMNFFTDVWKNFSTLEPLNVYDTPLVYNIAGQMPILIRGRKRAVWLCKNQIYQLNAREKLLPLDSNSPSLTQLQQYVLEPNNSGQLSNAFDLAAELENPEPDNLQTPLRFKITLQDILSKKRFV